LSAVISSLDAHRYLRARMIASSHEVGWRAVLLRAYEDPPAAECFTTPPTLDHLIVLVTHGTVNVEGRYRGRWQTATYWPGSVGMTSPGQEVTLRWHGKTRHSTLQLHLPAETLRECSEQVLGRSAREPEMPNVLAYDDPLIEHIVLELADAMRLGAPELYADSAAHLLATHLLVRHAKAAQPKPPQRDAVRMRRVFDYMRSNLGEAISLATLAKLAALSRFHLIRMFRHVYGETPHQCLTRLRVDEARRRLRRSEDPISNIALDCGFTTHAHFTAAFRHRMGVTPTAYRQQVRLRPLHS
jgi:AraC family transcriptional regulator